MEKKLNTRFNAFFYKFKDDIKTHITEELGDNITPQIQSKIMKYIYAYDGISITKEDLQRRKRVKNIVPLHCRCCAKRANGEQCTRRKKDCAKFCGTHIKGIPHGEISDAGSKESLLKKVQVWVQEVNGIIRHIDKTGNVYDPQDIYQNIENPKVIAKWTKTGDKYQIH